MLVFLPSDICGYNIYKDDDQNVPERLFPFKVTVLDRATGLAKIQLESEALLEFVEQHHFEFEIAAHDCDTGRHAAR